jgi:hypothetical protein
MADKLPSRPTLDIREALNELLRRNDRTQDKEVGEMYLGPDIFIARLRRPQVLEGSWQDIDRTVDLFDLIDAHQRGEGSLPPRGSAWSGERTHYGD